MRTVLAALAFSSVVLADASAIAAEFPTGKWTCFNGLESQWRFEVSAVKLGTTELPLILLKEKLGTSPEVTYRAIAPYRTSAGGTEFYVVKSNQAKGAFSTFAVDATGAKIGNVDCKKE